MKRDVIVAALIVLATLWAGYVSIRGAMAFSETESEKDWCYSHVSGQTMPAEYCEGEGHDEERSIRR